MIRKATLLGLLGALLLAACSPPDGGLPTELPIGNETPPPAAATPDPNEAVTHAPGDAATPIPQPWEPQPGDQNLERGPAYIEGSDVLILESFPVQIMLSLSGSLPTPCNQLRVTVAEPDAQNQIAVEVYSVADPAQICTQNLAPFEVNVPLGSFPSGDYSILANGEVIGEFSA